MLPPLAAYVARGSFILAPIRRQRCQLLDLGFQHSPGKLETGEPEIVGQQIGIGMRQALQYDNGSRASEVNHALAPCMPTSFSIYTADSVQTGAVPGSIQSPQRRHQ